MSSTNTPADPGTAPAEGTPAIAPPAGDLSPAPAAAPALAPAPASPAQPEPGEDPYERRFKGLQTSYNALQADLRRRNEELLEMRNLAHDWEAKFGELATSRDTLQTTYDAILSKSNDLQAELDARTREARVFELAATRYPHLLTGVAARVIRPDGTTDDEIAASLGRFDAWTKSMTAAHQAGTTPPLPPAAPARDEATIRREMAQVAMRGDTARVGLLTLELRELQKAART
ncbi:MAG: hypothetical protein HY784_13140 [Chloroflexi bacterium]|nr:hypothetical protein [Chloroflexota bacterium]